MALDNKKIIALLPMKGHSERVPLKNLRNFNGKPLYHAILNTLLSSDKIDEVIINTDCKNIVRDVEANFKSRVIVRIRPEAIRGDFVSMNKIIEETKDIAKVESKPKFEGRQMVMIIQPL